MVSEINIYVGMVIAGLFTGMGNAIGTYLSNKHLLKKIEALEEKLLKNARKN